MMNKEERDEMAQELGEFFNEIRELDMQTRMNFLGMMLEQTCPEFMFTLIMNHRQSKLANYISNAERADMIGALREMADRLEQGTTHDQIRDSLQ